MFNIEGFKARKFSNKRFCNFTQQMQDLMKFSLKNRLYVRMLMRAIILIVARKKKSTWTKVFFLEKYLLDCFMSFVFMQSHEIWCRLIYSKMWNFKHLFSTEKNFYTILCIKCVFLSMCIKEILNSGPF